MKSYYTPFCSDKVAIQVCAFCFFTRHYPLNHKYILVKTSFASVINMFVFFLVEKIEPNIHLEQFFYLLRKTWKYGGSVIVTEVAGGTQTA